MDIQKLIKMLDEIEDEETLNEIEIVAYSVKDALEIAKKELNTDIINLDYEILETGNSGFLGIGKKPYRILVKKIGSFTINQANEHVEEITSIDGKFFIAHTNEGIFVKIIPPQGRGRFIKFDEVKSYLEGLGFTNIDERKLSKEIENPSSTPVKIGEPIPTSPSDDSHPSIEVTPDESSALLTLSKPALPYGKVPTPNEVKNLLKSQGVVFGISDDEINRAIYEGVFDVPIEVAKWDPPVSGKDAKINYYVNINKQEQISIGGEIIDFHKVMNIQNVVKGQVLAVKEPATSGKPGTTVRGRVIPTSDGKDTNISALAGKNVEVSPDGMELIASQQGQIVMKNGKINVEPVLEIPGDVSTETGDIDFVGNVVIKGSVRDTFKVKAGGNVDIWGTVEKAEVMADGNVYIRTGIQGKEAGLITAGGDVVAKFIERAKIQAKGDVIALEYILHSNISSKSKIMCLGKKASITGGQVRAFHEIYAKQLGAESWVETFLEVGSDPEILQKHDELVSQKEILNNKLTELKKELLSLQQLMISYGKLPSDKEEKFQTLNMETKQLSNEITKIDEELSNLRQQLDQAAIESKISCYDICYPNVKIKIRDAIHICKDVYKFVTFKREGHNIIIVPYEEPKEIKEKKQELLKQGRRL
jgi:uncharacterized protein (DUF342 family)